MATEEAAGNSSSEGGYFDVIVVGAGIGGIGAAYRISRRNPELRYTILERRARIGGTWDLFRYPGVRSDSSIFTLSFPFEPWTRDEAVADGGDILEYVTATARKHDIDRHIRFNNHVRSANWDSSTDTWTVTVNEDGAERQYRSRFVFFGSGYYNYDEGYTPDFPGLDQFGGTVIHPQFWPADLDYTGKKIVVIGSGATAVTLIPALAGRAGKVTMLQRSPTYLVPGSRYNTKAERTRKRLPPKASHTVIRMRETFGGPHAPPARRPPATTSTRQKLSSTIAGRTRQQSVLGMDSLAWSNHQQ